MVIGWVDGGSPALGLWWSWWGDGGLQRVLGWGGGGQQQVLGGGQQRVLGWVGGRQLRVLRAGCWVQQRFLGGCSGGKQRVKAEVHVVVELRHGHQQVPILLK